MAFNISERIAMQLGKLSPDVPIYHEQQRGGFQEPSFFVNKITAHINPNLFGIQFRDNHFEVIYFPKVDKPNEDMDLMEDTLSDNFKQLEDFATVSDLEFERSDGTLIMMFRVSFRAVPVDNETKQYSIDYQGGWKHG